MRTPRSKTRSRIFAQAPRCGGSGNRVCCIEIAVRLFVKLLQLKQLSKGWGLIMAEEKKRLSLHDHSSSTRPSSMRRDERPRDPRGEKKPVDMRGRHRAERLAMFQAHRSETRDLSGNHAEEKRQMMLRHEKTIADLQDLHDKQERERASAPRWRKV
jgi:hypothetical protein